MKIVVVGGTRFIGRAIVEHLHASGHEVLVVHRGKTEPADLPPVEHLHLDRADLVAGTFDAFGPDAVVDCLAMTARDAALALGAAPSGARLLVLSSCDVYLAYTGVMERRAIAAVPLDEDAPVRTERYPLRDRFPDAADYEKLDVEEAYRARGGIVVRLPMVYGPYDGQRREWFVLRRVRAGRTRIPFGAGNWLSSRGFVRDVGPFVRLALERAPDGDVLNMAESPTPSVRSWAETILRAAGSDAELVRVADEALPEDLAATGALPQHLLVDTAKARSVLGWVQTDPAEALRTSVAWHLANPPASPDPGFDADDAALAGT